MKSKLFSLFFLLFLYSKSTISALQCSNYGYTDRCQIQNLDLMSADFTELKFPVQENYELYNAKVDYLSPDLMTRMQWISTLTIDNGKVRVVYLKPDLLKLNIRNSETVSIEIDSEPNGNLESLIVSNCHLEAIPNNVGKLMAMTTLTLNNNKIEFVNLSALSGLKKLTDINLTNNRIYSVAAKDTAELLHLKSLDLSGNYLTELDLTEWVMPRLHKLSITNNHLKYLRGLSDTKFPLLKGVGFGNNLWNCRWRDSFLPTFKKLKSNYDNTIDCAKSSELSVETYRQLNISNVSGSNISLTNQQQLEEQFDSITQNNLNQAKLIAVQTEKLEQQEKSITEANKQLLNLQETIEKLLQRVESLELAKNELKQVETAIGDDPSTSGVPKGLSAKLIDEISEVIRKHLASYK